MAKMTETTAKRTFVLEIDEEELNAIADALRKDEVDEPGTPSMRVWTAITTELYR